MTKHHEKKFLLIKYEQNSDIAAYILAASKEEVEAKFSQPWYTVLDLSIEKEPFMFPGQQYTLAVVDINNLEDWPKLAYERDCFYKRDRHK